MKNFYQKHIFFCTNLKTEGKQCCAEANPEHYFQYARSCLKQRDLVGEGKIRVSKAGCLGRCAAGPCIVIYPEGVWYTFHNEADIEVIIEQHCQNHQLVPHLLLDAPLE